MAVTFTLTTEELKNKNSRIEELLSAISTGDISAMEHLYDLIRTDVFAYALSKLGSKHDADDIMQDTFVQVYKYAGQYRPMGKPMAWIIKIELNLIRRHYQMQSRTVELDDGSKNQSTGEGFEKDVINSAFLCEIMKTLTEEEREIVALHTVSGLKHREIAGILGKPLSTVLSKYNRAIKKLRAIAKEDK